MNQQQLDELSVLVRGIAETLVRIARLAYFDFQPKDQATKLSTILRATDHLLKLLSVLEHEVGQDLEKTPFNAPLVQEIQMASHILNVEKRAAYDPEDYPSNVIRSLRSFRATVAKAHAQIKPKRGNATSRKRNSSLKSDIAKNLVFQYRSKFGIFPATTTDGWAATLLNEIFQNHNLGDNGAYWLRCEVEKLKKSTS